MGPSIGKIFRPTDLLHLSQHRNGRFRKPTFLFLEPKTLSWENTRTQTQEADQSQELLETQEPRHKKQTSLKNPLRHKNSDTRSRPVSRTP
ncbi:hypothetical protein CEXT_322741 [Caerostris extrusa]|uniref:Uncharacterized protein n=1 Tax=Caerostris extrusa TaxID=172846 RepID=A0AAV4MS90_CAEEX|nr:hypothetical protein CEXT_322741 [Caerostris extrusa]